MSSFQKIGSTLVEHKIPLTLYRSSVSGCKVVIIDHPSAMVNAEISLATAHENDSGLAHTLEHLVFMGSKKYPYAEFLTNLAERSYGYINAFTSFDNTAFQMKTVGADGFIKLLPVYLDNLLNPTLTDSAYTTEVHHINGEGQDAGVVYSEMKGRDFREILKLNEFTLGKDSPFARNLGGDPKDIRETCSPDKIKAYHSKYYKMENVFISVAGTVSHENVLKAVSEFEQNNGFTKGGFKRTYEDFNPEPFKQRVERVQIPVEGDHGTVRICWRGPDIWGPEMFPMSELLKYFTSGPESILYKHYINSSPPICSTLAAKSDKQKVSIIGFEFHGTNAQFLTPEQEHRFREELLELIRSHEFDLSRLHDIIRRDIEQIGRFLENDVSSSIFSDIRQYQNYAPDISSERDDMKHLASCHIEECEKALTYDVDYWKSLVERYLTEDYLLMYALPSKELIEKEKAEEDERIKQQVERLGPEGLKKCAQKVEEAVATNKSSEAGNGLLNEYTVKNIGDISIVPVERSIGDGGPLDVPTVVHKTGSNFVVFKLFFDGQDIPKVHLPLLKLYMNLINQSSALIDGKLVPCEELSAKRKSEILEFKLNCSLNKIRIQAMSTLQNLDKVPYWLDVYLNKLVFDKTVVERVLTKLITYADEYKRHDNVLVESLGHTLVENPETIDYYYSEIEVQNFHRKLLEGLKDDKFADNLIRQLTDLRNAISSAQINLHLVGNPGGIDNVELDKWPKLRGKVMLLNEPSEIDDYSRSTGKSLCIARPECTSAYLQQTVQAPFKTKSVELVYSNLLNLYFCESSGVLHTEVRGKGFAYHVALQTTRDVGIKLKIHDASNLPGAYNLSKKVVTDVIASGKLDPEIFEIAKRGLIMRCVNAECTIAQAGANSFKDHMKGYGVDENEHQIQIKIINAATPEVVLKAVGQHYLNLFDDSKSSRAMVVPTSTTDGIQETFSNVEFKTVDDLCKDVNVDFVANARL